MEKVSDQREFLILLKFTDFYPHFFGFFFLISVFFGSIFLHDSIQLGNDDRKSRSKKRYSEKSFIQIFKILFQKILNGKIYCSRIVRIKIIETK